MIDDGIEIVADPTPAIAVIDEAADEAASPARWRDRQLSFARRMTDAEALMWNVEKDPWLNPSGASIGILDRPLDFDQFRHRVRYAVSQVSRLRERVVPGLGRLAPPEWRTDPEFDLDYHVRHLSLPPPGSTRQLLDLVTRLYEDPFDRTRPVWLFVAIDGVQGGRGALFGKIHHSIADGIGAVRLSELYMEVRRDDELPPGVDLDAVIAAAVEAEAEDDTDESPANLARTALGTAGHIVRRQLGIGRRILGEAAVWGADPRRPLELGVGAVDQVRSLLGELSPEVAESGSPVWAERSRGRHLEVLRLELDDARKAGKALGGTVNDVFLTGVLEGVADYHEARDVVVDWFNATFVVSTRADHAAGGNAFTPTRVQLPGQPMSVERRFSEVATRLAAKREGVRGSGALAGLAGVANLLPTSVVTRMARSQAANIDFATSNLRAAPFPVYISGAKVLESYPMGPVAGTAFNVTMMSYDGTLFLGVFVDPAAVAEPVELRDRLRLGLDRVLAAGGATGRAS